MSSQGNKGQETNAPGSGKKIIHSPESDLPFWSAGRSSSGEQKQGSSRQFFLGASPLIPAVIALLSVILLVYSGWFQQGLKASGNLPVVQAISALFRKDPALDSGVRVWVRHESGFYYCHGNVLFGRRPGKLQAQGGALTSGYRPADGQYCSEGKQVEHSPAGPSSAKSTGTR
jgi:hypothetical protein